MSEIKAAIFDLDGVIVDTAKYHYLAWKKLADQLGFEFTERDNERLKGVSRMRSLEILLKVGNKEFDDETKQELATKKNTWYVDYISSIDESELLPGAKDYLIRIRNRGLKTALGSASKNAPLIIKNLNITECFDAIVDGNSVSKAKPDPEVFLRAADELGVAPEQCIVFEDAEAGILAAKNANMKCVGIGSEENLSMADLVISGLDKAPLV